MTLKEFFYHNKEAAIAFSGGVDSAYLLAMAKKYCLRVKAYYVKSEFQPSFEYEDALRLAEQIDVDLCVLQLSALVEEKVRKNPENRCYYCKKNIFNGIVKAAWADGFSLVLDGTNASDDEGDRPGMKALKEMNVASPLRLCGLTKDEIRKKSRELGLFTWNKPAYACLATRIPAGEEITKEKLKSVEEAESYLFSLGFEDFRVRSRQGNAVIQIREEQWNLMNGNRQKVLEKLGKDFKSVLLDLKTREG